MKKGNEYTDLLPYGKLANIPKTVIAACLISEYLNRLNIDPNDIYETILQEWQTLHTSGIVPQKPPKNETTL